VENVFKNKKLEAALLLAKKGFYVHPLKPNSKEPALNNWQKLATRDPKQITTWFTNGHAKGNVGIFTGKFQESEALVVVDVDQKEGKMGEDELFKLELNGMDFPSTLEQTTPNGGRHLIYKTSEPLKQGVDVLAKGLDIRSDGGNLACIGSSIGEREYLLVDREVASSPPWLVSRLRRPTPKPKDGPAQGAYRVNEENALSRARHYLEVEAPTAILGSRNDTTFKVACRVKDFGVKWAQCYDLMWEAWAPRCDSCLDMPEFEAVIGSAYKYGEKPQGIDSPEAQFTIIKDETVKTKRRLYGETLAETNPDYNQVFLVDKYLQPSAMTVVYGASGSGKTFFVLNLALHIALGRSWNERNVMQGLVIYVAAEGGWGIKKRIKAFKDYHKVNDGPFVLVPCPINLLDPKTDVKELLEIVKTYEAKFGLKSSMIVIDTLARAMSGGNENSSEDMGAFVENIGSLQNATGAHLLVIHHSGKDVAKGARGHSSLKAATDTEIEIHNLTAKMTKQRDADLAPAIGFKLEQIVIGHQPNGQPVYSCVVLPSHSSAVKDFSKPQLESHRLTGKGYKALQMALDWNPQPAPDDLDLGDDALVVSVEDWREQFYKLAYPGETKVKSWNVAFTRMVKELVSLGYVKTNDSLAWIP
jgi:hypothetical protein